ncbi:hypothetical protein AZZ63_001439 [Enterobacter hormaechei]|uniref:hypothetical protein n=1 Tax=Enterobacter hormaechei TaxID=158836 RepID=UPI000B739E30|nr:hypothetical protein [Enterobacter hormaechei]OUF34371.1 hypothetical protein AZZ63_001439 [Enterobacter hormaechei]
MSKTTEGLTMNQLAERNAEYVTTIEQLQQKLIESERYGRQTDITIDNLEMKLAQMAAELNAVEAIHTEAVFITDDHYEQCPPEVQKIIRSLAVMQIPAYQAFLAEVRASALDEFARAQDERAKKYYELSPGCSAQDECQFAAGQAWYFAECIRKGVQS